MTGQELYELLQAQGPAFFWARWEALTPGYRNAMDLAAECIRDRQREAVYEATAGEDI